MEDPELLPAGRGAARFGQTRILASSFIQEVIKMTYTANNVFSRFSCRALGFAYDRALSNFPNTVQIETTNACNASCTICTHSKMKRGIGFLDFHLYTKLIDECAQFKCRNVHLHNFGEPLLDKDIAKRIRYAKQRGLERVQLFTNGSLLSLEKSHEIVDAGLDEIKISFDGATKEEFEKLRKGLSYDKVLNNIRTLYQIKERASAPLKIKIACCSTSSKDKTTKMLEEICDEFSFGKIHNWADPENLYRGERTLIRKPCSRVWRTFTVLSDGCAALCCLDYEGDVILGDVKKSSITDIWNNPLYVSMRRHHRNAEQGLIGICKNCDKSYW
jgi:MoaA/NifB/PqqE/SkfB family radical SAM enzyme